jgi:4-hydroxybenzoate polyprenyltransferase
MDFDLTSALGVMIPITAVFMGILLAIVSVYLRFRRQKEEQETMRIALEKGVELPEDFFKSDEIGNGRNRYSSLKWGIFWTTGGLALFIALWVNQGIEEAVWGLIPFAIGIGLIVYYKLSSKNNHNKVV